MTTISFDVRVSARARDAYTATSSVMRTGEHNVLRSVESSRFNRTGEHYVLQAWAKSESLRTGEYMAVGSVQASRTYRTGEHQVVPIDPFTSDQARLVNKIFESSLEVNVQAREISYIYNPRFRSNTEARINANAVTVKSAESFDLLFHNIGQLNQRIEDQPAVVEQVDYACTFNWKGTFDSKTRFGVAFNDTNDLGADKAIDLSLPKTTKINPTLKWSASYNPENDQTIDYVLQLSDTFTMKKLLAEKVLTTTSWIVDVTLKRGKTYFWRVKARDKFGDKVLNESDWSNVMSFDVVSTADYISQIPNTATPSVRQTFWKNPYLLPPGQTYYIWNTSNLPPKDGSGNRIPYRFILYMYQFEGDVNNPTNIIVTRKVSQSFFVEHTAANPPIFLSASYDEQQHHVVFQVQINDSMGRKYQLKDFQWIDRSDPSNTSWQDIEDQRIIGQKENLNSIPNATNRGMVTWSASGDADYPNYQDLKYNLRFFATPEFRNNDFHYFIELLRPEDKVNLLDTSSENFGDYWGTKYGNDDLPALNLVPENQSIDSYFAPFLVPYSFHNLKVEIATDSGVTVKTLDFLNNTNLFQQISGFRNGVATTSVQAYSTSESRDSQYQRIFDITPFITGVPNGNNVFIFVDVLWGTDVVTSMDMLHNSRAFEYWNGAQWTQVGQKGIPWKSGTKVRLHVPPNQETDADTLNLKVQCVHFLPEEVGLRYSKFFQGIQSSIHTTSPSVLKLYPDFNEIRNIAKQNNYRFRIRFRPMNVSNQEIGSWSDWRQVTFVPGATPRYKRQFISPAFKIDQNTPSNYNHLYANVYAFNAGTYYWGNGYYSFDQNPYVIWEFSELGDVWEPITETQPGTKFGWVRLRIVDLNLDSISMNANSVIRFEMYNYSLDADDYIWMESEPILSPDKVKVIEYATNHSLINSSYLSVAKNALYSLRFSEVMCKKKCKLFVDFKRSYWMESLKVNFQVPPRGNVEVEYLNNAQKVGGFSYPVPYLEMFSPINQSADSMVITMEAIDQCTIREMIIPTYPIGPSRPDSLIYVDTEETDIVMKDFEVELRDYFGQLGIIESGIDGKVNTSLDPNTPDYTTYGKEVWYRISLFRDNLGNELLYSKTGKTVGTKVILTNLELFQEGITNIILNFRDIVPTFYELKYSDIEMIEKKIGSSEYWIAVRGRDFYYNENQLVPIEYSPWSDFAVVKPSNVYTLRWAIAGMNINPTKDVYFRCRAIIATVNGDIQIPIIGFLPQGNPAYTKIVAEETATVARKEQVTTLKTELEQRINSVITGDSITISF